MQLASTAIHSETLGARVPSLSTQVFEGAYDWLVAHIDDLRISRRTGRARPVAVKRLAELAMLAHALDSSDLRAFAWSELGRGEAIAECLDEDPGVAIAYLPFAIAGTRSDTLENVLARRTWDHPAWPPVRRYAVGFVLEEIGAPVPWDMTATLAATLGRGCSGNFALHVEILAHVTKWRTHFGARPEALSRQERAALIRRAPMYGAELLVGGAFDLLCELAVANRYAGGPPLHHALAAIAFAQRDDGSVPPYRGAGSQFADVYHATLATALATSPSTCRG